MILFTIKNNNDMKKAFSLFSIIAMAGLCLMFTSCSDDDTEEAMHLSGQWQGDWGMYYGYTYPNGDYVEYDSYDTDIIFYPDYDYATHGYGYQVDWYDRRPNANGNISPYQRLSYRFNWSIINGVINLTYPGYPEYNTSIRDYRLNNSHFTGYFPNSSEPFRLNKIQDFYSWYDYDNLYRSYGYVYLEWDWSGVYYYDSYYAKTRSAEATDSVGKPAEGRITKIGSRLSEK